MQRFKGAKPSELRRFWWIPHSNEPYCNAIVGNDNCVKYRAGRRFRGITMPTERFRRGAVRANRMANDSAIRTKILPRFIVSEYLWGWIPDRICPFQFETFWLICETFWNFSAELDKICLWKMRKKTMISPARATWSNTSTELYQVLDIQILTHHQLKYNFKYLNKKILVLEELL